MNGEQRKFDLVIVLVIVASVGLGCLGMKRPWRDYSERPFDSAEWLAGDKIERGRMIRDMGVKRSLNGMSKDEIVKALGESDLKKTIERREVWFYRVDIGIPGGMDLIPISFNEKGMSEFGMVTGSTYSIMAKEEDL